MRAGGAHHVFLDHDAADVVSAEAQPDLAGLQPRGDPRRLNIQNIFQIQARKRQHLETLSPNLGRLETMAPRFHRRRSFPRALVPNPHAFQPSKLERIILQVVPDASTRRIVLERGDVDLITPADPSRHPAPRLGEHTVEVLRELGIDDDTVAEYKAEGVVA